MKKIKILLIVFLTIFLTGCSANYNIEIYNGTVNEDITFEYPYASIEDSSPLKYAEAKSIELFDETNVLFSRNWVEENNKMSSKYSLDFGDYSKEIVGLINCYDLMKITNYENVMTILTTDQFKCFDIYPDLDVVTLKIKSNHKLIETNADRRGLHTYYWDINRSNANDKKILLKLKSNKYVFNYNNEFLKKLLVYAGLIGGIVGIMILVYRFLRTKNKNVNQI